MHTIDTELSIDRAQWLLESHSGQGYHMVSRWQGGNIKELCAYLIKLADEDYAKKGTH